jgi:hypothetical protein
MAFGPRGSFFSFWIFDISGKAEMASR